MSDIPCNMSNDPRFQSGRVANWRPNEGGHGLRPLRRAKVTSVSPLLRALVAFKFGRLASPKAKAETSIIDVTRGPVAQSRNRMQICSLCMDCQKHMRDHN